MNKKKENLLKSLIAIIIILSDIYVGKDTIVDKNLSVNQTPDVDNTQKIEKNIDVNKGNNIDQVDNVDKGLIKEKYRGKPYIHLKKKPKFVLTKSRYKSYSAHDSLGRCGVAEACVDKNDMPKRKRRGSIGMIKPSGWHTIRYNNVDGKYLYNRCHLLAWSITGTLKDDRNLITGTRYMNIKGMCDQEEKIRRYLKYSNNHVMYRVTPVFKGKELVARGVHIEVRSVEDDKLIINDYAFNVQPGIVIDYSNGNSRSENSN